MARYQVPQNIDMEDKIVGPLTMLQFVYLMIGGMIIYLAWTVFDIQLFLLIAVPVGLFALAMAFVKVQDQPFPKFMAAFLLYLVRPKSRVWQKEQQLSQLKLTKKTEVFQPTGGEKTFDRDKSAELASILDLDQSPTRQAPQPTRPATVPPNSTDAVSSKPTATPSIVPVSAAETAQTTAQLNAMRAAANGTAATQPSNETPSGV